MQQAGPVRLYGKRGCPAAYAIRDYLQRSGIPFKWIELRDNEQASKELGLEGVDDSRLPICLFPDGTRMERPTVREITEKLGWFRNPSRSEYDLATSGAGPAGLSASVYGASEGLRTVLIERLPWAAKPVPAQRLRTTSAFPKGSVGRSSPSGRASRPASLARRYCCTGPACAANSLRAKAWSISTMAPRSSRASQSAPPVSSRDG